MSFSHIRVSALVIAFVIGSGAGLAQGQPARQLCKVLLDSEEHGAADDLAQHAELTITSINRDPDGGLIALGSGTTTVQYFKSAGCAVVSGSPFTKPISVIVSSDDGKTAEVDFTPFSKGIPVTVAGQCGTTDFMVVLDPPPTVTVPLKDGGSAPYDDSAGSGKHRIDATGRVTFAYCKPPGQ